MEFNVEKLVIEPGETVEFDRVALIEQDGKVQIGTPWIKGAKVTCRVLSHLRGRKVLASTRRPRSGIQRGMGHRQSYTRVRVEKIAVGRSRATKES
ncbi:MAG: 50S ribosomal protein L21 [Armatimonadetes bacterium]|nr:50S ribosomal protein L21 [Armatimonadota bacterium]